MASSFARKTAETPGNNQSKKLVLVAVLGAALVFLLIHQFGGAKTSDAATADAPQGGGGGEVPAESPRDVLDYLKIAAKPKTKFISKDELAALEKAPADPFRISNKWLTTLSRPAPVEPKVVIEVKQPIEIKQPVEIKQPNEIKQPVVPTAVWEPTNIKIGGIFRDGSRYLASINNSIVSEGTVIAGAKIVEIALDHITVQQAGNPNGQLYSLSTSRFQK